MITLFTAQPTVKVYASVGNYAPWVVWRKNRTDIQLRAEYQRQILESWGILIGVHNIHVSGDKLRAA